MRKFLTISVLLFCLSILVKAQDSSYQKNNIDNSVNRKSYSKKTQMQSLTDSSSNNLALNMSFKDEAEEKSIWEIIPLYSSIIINLLWLFLIVLTYLLFKRNINKILFALARRIKKGSSFQAGPFSIGAEMVKDTQQWADLEKGEKIYGNPDHFITLFKIVSGSLKKSTKAMAVGDGCLVQVTTEKLSEDGMWAVAEALTYIPGIKIVEDNPADYSNFETGRGVGFHLEKA